MKIAERRLQALEEGLSPLQRAHMLIRRGVSPEAWPDEELTAYVETLPPEIRALSDEQLECIINAPLGQANKLLRQFTRGAHNATN